MRENNRLPFLLFCLKLILLFILLHDRLVHFLSRSFFFLPLFLIQFESGREIDAVFFLTNIFEVNKEIS
jgi:hypothetical protein